MSNTLRNCFLRCLKTGEKIPLPHSVVVTVGRKKEYGIEDVNVSKNQIECKSDCAKCQVNVKVIGKNSSGCNGYALVSNKNYILGHADILELRLTLYEYEIVFEPPPEESEEMAPKPKKMKFDFSIFNMGNSKKTSGDTDIPSCGKWEDVDGKELLIFTHNNCISQNAIAGFDIDGTIITTKSGARFPKDSDDWILNYMDIPQKLKLLFDENYKIVFFTNQSGVGKDSHKIKEFKRKIENIIKKLNLPIQVFIATTKSFYRKPIPGMWNALCNNKNDDVTIDLSKSFYVGDAAGRPKNWAPKRKKDHSCADRLFAMNIGIRFYTPEEYFLKNKPVEYIMPEFDPTKLSGVQYPSISYSKSTVIIMVGGPGSGKTHFCKKVLIPKGYVHVSRDFLGTMQKCERVLEENLLKKNNVVIDNTNPDKKSRQGFINISKKYGVNCICCVMSTSVKHSKHNNKFRELTDKKHEYISEILINKYKNNFQEPEQSEGFTEILRVPFVSEFDSDEKEKLYKMYLLES